VDFGPIGVVDHVTIGHDSIKSDEETAASRELFSARIESFDGYRRWLYATHEFRKQILRPGSVANIENKKNCAED
jgi:hypothetical protein